jgi:transcriptional regulator with XRE-family HTH domain
MATKVKQTGDEAKQARKEAGAYIQKLRLKADLSQLELAKRLGYPYYSFISQVEGGVVRLPPDGLRAWARALGVDVETFAKTLLRHYEPYYFDALFGGRSRRKEES